MGCVSSHLLNHDDDFTQIGTSAFSHHIVSLTSTTYGLLTLDPSSSPTTVPPTPPPRFTLGSIFPSPLSEPRSDPPPEVINSWELMAGLDSTTESFRFSPQPSKPSPFRYALLDKENLNPATENSNPKHKNPISIKPMPTKPVFLNGFEEICPPKGENKIVIYTTTLRGVRRTFEACNAVRAVLEGFGVFFCERDISMDRGFRDELWELMKGKDKQELVPPRVFVKGRYVGGADEVLKIVEDGFLGHLLEGLPKLKPGYVCDVCGGVRFLPCLTCNGSCKMLMVLKKEMDGKQLGTTVTVKCSDCNENGLVRCSICS
ncbi:uncharacterized protein At5g39865-like [Cynara cardunculus var. scolymus]|uniref:Glutaredoxin n=1 Tax=Cynara cardunculus var. scolymus TaxID=59895 RepID=A0A118JUB5_CYNCS|nr:uncharacterized protein At5g39865-like [Cynara cardunculus var. scolymus]KVH91751.1 Glutaredoxin [Cynara cardunculus var. scolymus]